jgi:two-component system chemotaxis sensor kinase CheA
MSSDDFVQFKTLFLKTAREHLDSIRLAVDTLRKTPDNTETMNAVYIAAHSVKGESLALGYQTNASLAQLIEKVFHAGRDGEIKITPEILDAVSTAVEKLSSSIDSIEREDKEDSLNEARMQLEKISGIHLTE